jgi:hypothetical protein
MGNTKAHIVDALTPAAECFHDGKPVVIKDFKNPHGSYKVATYGQLAAAWDKLSMVKCKLQDWMWGERFEHLPASEMVEMTIEHLDQCKLLLGHVGRFIDHFEEPPDDGRYILYDSHNPPKPDKPRFIIKERRLRGQDSV